MRTATAHRRLKNLHGQIRARLGPGRSFFYSPEAEVRGCEGEGPVIIISYRPSTDGWKEDAPSRRLLYDTIKAHALGHAYLTDCIKERSRVKDDKKDYDLDWNLRVLKEELEILHPEALIALGADTKRFLAAHGFAKQHRISEAYHFGIIHNWYLHWHSASEAQQAFKDSFAKAADSTYIQMMELWVQKFERIQDSMQRMASHLPGHSRLKEEHDSLVITISAEMKRRGMVF